MRRLCDGGQRTNSSTGAAIGILYICMWRSSGRVLLYSTALELECGVPLTRTHHYVRRDEKLTGVLAGAYESSAPARPMLCTVMQERSWILSSVYGWIRQEVREHGVAICVYPAAG